MSEITKEDIRLKYDLIDYVEESIIIPSFKNKTGIILIVGSSGSGKTTILKSLGYKKINIENEKTVLDNFSNLEEAERLLISMGLRSIPTWFRPLNTLSNGEKHRAECAIYLHNNENFIDEFTSVVDRDTAKSLSASFRKYIDKSKTVYIATCHRDVIEWLQPDYIYDTDLKKFTNGRFLRRPSIELNITPSSFENWVYFRKHHYLSGALSKSAHCYEARINNKPVAFLAVIHSTGRDIKSYWREHRLVVLPEFQGLGIGKTLSNVIAEQYKRKGLRYFSKTAHCALGEYREKSELWKGTSTNKKARPSYLKKDGTVREQKGFGKTKDTIKRDAIRVCYSHEYIGNAV